jgi:hypothetical protein
MTALTFEEDEAAATEVLGKLIEVEEPSDSVVRHTLSVCPDSLAMS